MNLTEEKAISIAQAAMHSIDWTYDQSQPSVAVFQSKEEISERLKILDNFKDIEHKIKSIWSISFQFPQEMELYRNTMFVEIDDETGEPTTLRHKQATFKFVKKSDGWELKQVYP